MLKDGGTREMLAIDGQFNAGIRTGRIFDFGLNLQTDSGSNPRWLARKD